MIAYVRSWQNIVNRFAAENGTTGFQFNTYIISVLVIFFFQIKYYIPKVNDLRESKLKSLDDVPNMDKQRLKRVVMEFFEFYANKYDFNTQIMSVKYGQWEEQSSYKRNWLSKLSLFCRSNTKQQNSAIRNDIALSPKNWENCTMLVQDIKAPGVNITAEISSQEAINFQNMCQIFHSNNSHVEHIDTFLLKRETQSVVTMEKPCTSATDLKNPVSTRPATTVQQAKPPKVVISSVTAVIDPTQQATSSSKVNNTQNSTKKIENVNKIEAVSLKTINRVSQKPCDLVKLEKLIQIENVFESSQTKMKDFLTQSIDRTKNEKLIFDLLSLHFKCVDKTLRLVSFGSSSYGFGGKKTNFNILIKSGEVFI